MASRKKNIKKAQRQRQKQRLVKLDDRRLLRRALWQLAWVLVGVAALVFWMLEPERNWWLIGIWLLGSAFWGGHLLLRLILNRLGKHS